MTKRVITTAATATWPPTRTSECWPVAATWAKGTALEVAAGSALETAVGLGNTRVTTDVDFRTPKDGSTSN